MFNTEAEKKLLTQSLLNTEDVGSVIDSLHYVSQNHTPFALYIATADRSSCMWIFDPPTVYDMLGGEDIHDKTFRSVFTDEIERDNGILFYVMRKIGPVIVVRLGEETILSVIDSLQGDVSHLDANSRS